MPDLIDERPAAELRDEIKRLQMLLNDLRWFLVGVRGAAWLDPADMIRKIDESLKGE